MRMQNGKNVGSFPHQVRPIALVLAGCAVLFAVGAHARAQASTKTTAGETSKGNAENGKRLFTSSGCYECHGRQAQGSRFSGPRLAPDPISFSSFEEYIRAPKGQMPPYTSKVLTNAELADIHAFLESLPKPPAAKTIPLLN